ncbi:MAG: pilus assembly protein PilY [Xanthomonadaceae bacterium]|nr:pilus assembly protein PilY [Xanthomonadaceae bacterium]MDE3071363.1 pilus assembly protein PilY [Pseudomonadota bacterium]
MNIIFRPRSKAARFLGRLLYCSLSVWMLGAVGAPARAVTVDQQPLTVQKPLPPNITLMLDDSGSMAWDFMPDAGYLAGNITATDEYGYGDTYLSADALRNAAVNGTYYNPSVTYTPAVQANGTIYNATAQPSLTSAYTDGIQSTGSTDVTQFTSASLCDYNGWSMSPSGCPSSLYYSFPYYTAFPSSGTTYAPTLSCNWGDKSTLINGLQMCLVKSSSPAQYYVPTYNCTKSNGDKYNYATGYCESGNPRYNYLFTYTKGPAGGTYTRYYVGSSSCAGQTNCVLATDTSGAAAPKGVAAGQNIANWFSYYHTRILMAKTGLMTAFSGINPTFRIGFGSIDGNNKSGLPSSKYSYSDTYNGGTNYIANVQPFGDGSSGTQKSNFWSWLAGESAGNGTPLRQALNAVGQYYETSQPWQTSEDDTTELACRQSYTILTTDGFWNGNNLGNPNIDGTAGPTNTSPNGQSYTYNNVAPYADSYSDTLADVAMKYWKTDLRSTVANEVPPSTDDPAFWQHMTTFTMGLGFAPLYADQATPIPMDQVFSWANGGTPISGFSWPQPAPNSINNIADLAHAAVNGHGGFFSATSPQSFLSGIQDALKRATARVGAGASLAANSTQLKTGTVAYQANYITSKWKGDLEAFAVDPNTGAIATTTTWTAVTALPAAASRNIWSYNPAASTSKQFVAFQNSTSGSGSPPALSSAELSALGSGATAQENMVNYLRGDSSLEQKNIGGIYRNRDTPFGDVVDSQPIFVGAPDPNEFSNETFTGASSYLAFASNTALRAPLIFVAANDGMLHALDATTGAETFAYIPAAVITSGLSQLSDPNYGGTVPHQYFNDGELTVADAYFSSAWHTVAVGTTGRGTAEAVYAFDVTDPTNIQFLWERSAGDGLTNSAYIGQMTGKPIIAQTADSSWSVLIGNGYNSAKGVAALLQFNLATGALTVHTTTDTSTSNGLAAPAVWLDNPTNGVSTEAYAGDLDGHVWSFILNNGTTGTPSSTGSLLFTATDASGNVQPITAGMLAGKDPATGNVWVFFGTGEYLSSADLTNLATQSWYGLIVQSSDSTLVSNLSTGRAALVQRAIVAETAGNTTTNPPVLPARAVTPPSTPSDMTGKSGWYMDLTSPVNGAEGERIVTPNQFQGNLLLGTTRIPQAVDLCNPSGRGWIMAIDPFTGTNPVSNFFDLNGDGLINSSDTITVNGKQVAAAGMGFDSLPNNPIFVGSSMLVSFDNDTRRTVNTSGSSGSIQRVSWRELINQ